MEVEGKDDPFQAPENIEDDSNEVQKMDEEPEIQSCS